jgi:16S rRNA (cytosine1402-N4)-methyltransferase
MLQQSASVLKPGGLIAVISFHSLEDRMVKNFFKQGSFGEVETDDVYGGRPASIFNIITKKPILPGAAEQKANPRSRSAKLRIAEKK